MMRPVWILCIRYTLHSSAGRIGRPGRRGDRRGDVRWFALADIVAAARFVVAS